MIVEGDVPPGGFDWLTEQAFLQSPEGDMRVWCGYRRSYIVVLVRLGDETVVWGKRNQYKHRAGLFRFFLRDKTGTSAADAYAAGYVLAKAYKRRKVRKLNLKEDSWAALRGIFWATLGASWAPEVVDALNAAPAQRAPRVPRAPLSSVPFQRNFFWPYIRRDAERATYEGLIEWELLELWQWKLEPEELPSEALLKVPEGYDRFELAWRMRARVGVKWRPGPPQAGWRDRLAQHDDYQRSPDTFVRARREASYPTRVRGRR